MNNKFEVTDQATYRTVTFTVEGEDQIYYVKLTEGLGSDEWQITDVEYNEIDEDSDLWNELVELCENELI